MVEFRFKVKGGEIKDKYKGIFTVTEKDGVIRG
jgi:hypothetical protein